MLRPRCRAAVLSIQTIFSTAQFQVPAPLRLQTLPMSLPKTSQSRVLKNDTNDESFNYEEIDSGFQQVPDGNQLNHILMEWSVGSYIGLWRFISAEMRSLER